MIAARSAKVSPSLDSARTLSGSERQRAGGDGACFAAPRRPLRPSLSASLGLTGMSSSTATGRAALRATLLALAAAALVAGCGESSDSTEATGDAARPDASAFPATDGRTLEEIAQQEGTESRSRRGALGPGLRRGQEPLRLRRLHGRARARPRRRGRDLRLEARRARRRPVSRRRREPRSRRRLPVRQHLQRSRRRRVRLRQRRRHGLQGRVAADGAVQGRRLLHLHARSRAPSSATSRRSRASATRRR